MIENIKKYIVACIVLLSVIFFCMPNNKVDILIYSYHRPLQLYALLESIKMNMNGYNNVYIIYRADNHKFEQGYQIVQQVFSSYIFLKQSDTPSKDFKPLTLQVLGKSSPYIILSVDDIIVKDTIDLQSCMRALQSTRAYGFFLRLGTNLSYCYSLSAEQAVPPLSHVGDDMYTWHFKVGQHDWGYPFSLDMTLYPKESIEKMLQHLSYMTPNSFEANGAAFAAKSIIPLQKGLCFFNSKIVNIPLNIVQNDYPQNNHLNRYSIERLLQLLYEGYKIDITPLMGIQNRSAHADIELTFIQR